MDIYELLNKIIVNESFKLSPYLFTQADRDCLDESARPLFDLLKNISSLGTEIHDLGDYIPSNVRNGRWAKNICC